MAIKVDRKGIIHYYAQCENDHCQFDSSMGETIKGQTKYFMPEDVRRAVRMHVEKTGHQVIIESGSATLYTKDI